MTEEHKTKLRPLVKAASDAMSAVYDALREDDAVESALQHYISCASDDFDYVEKAVK